MYKVLIVDDEKIVRIAVQSIVDWEAYGFTVVATAENGDTALQLLRQHQPHLLITDIVMPQMDGIRLTKQARAEGYPGEIVFLSNHQDFQYALEALHNSVHDYIFKSDISAETLVNMLQQVKKKLDRSPVGLEQNIVNPSQAADYQLLQAAVGQTLPEDSDGTLSQPYLFLDIFLKEKLYGLQSTVSNVPKNTLKNIVLECTKRDPGSVLAPSGNYVLLCFPQAEKEYIITSLEQSLEQIQKLIRLYMNTEAGFLCSSFFSSTGEFTRKCTHLSEWERLVLYYGFGSLIHESDFLRYSNKSWNVLPLVASLKERILAGDSSGCVALFQEEIQRFSHRLPLPSGMNQAISELFRHLLLDNAIWLESAEQELQLLSQEYKRCCTLDDYIQSFQNFIELIIQRRLMINRASCREEVKQIDHYIRENLNVKISLAMIADYINLSETYISRLFKSETGMNLTTYINYLKIEKAKEILSSQDASIKDISITLGYEEPSYFNKIFNRIVGMNPSEYKKKMSNNQNLE